MQLPPRADSLIALLDRMVELLEWDGQTYWNVKVREASSLLRQGNRRGFGSFLSCFGTAGSFNECTVGKDEWKDKVHTWLPGHEEKHREFERLKDESYVIARELDQESQPPLRETLATAIAGSRTSTRVLFAILVALILFAAVWRPQ